MSILRNLLAPLQEAPSERAVERSEPFGFQGNTYYGQARSLSYKGEATEADFRGLIGSAYKANGPIFACMLTRMSIFTEARFQFRRLSRTGRPGDLFGNLDLAILERPWVNGTTGDLLARMVTDSDLAGNFYAARRGDRLKRMRPDWVSIVIGSDDDASVDSTSIDAEVIGYIYHPGGPALQRTPVPLLPEEVVHFAPIPDPDASYRGMSWLTPVIAELEADTAATLHKRQFFRGGATPRVLVRFPGGVSQESANAFADKMDAVSQGWENAYKTLYVGEGADATVLGADLQQLDFKATQGAGETRIAAAAGVHPVVVGLSEGLAGSSLNAGNFNSARRLVADKTMRPLWRMAAASLANVVTVPSNAELWYDDRDIAFLREDLKERADVLAVKATTINTLVTAGFTPESASAAVEAEDMSLLVHSGLLSVQLHDPSNPPPPPTAPMPAMSGVSPKEPAMANGSSNGQETP